MPDTHGCPAHLIGMQQAMAKRQHLTSWWYGLLYVNIAWSDNFMTNTHSEQRYYHCDNGENKMLSSLDCFQGDFWSTTLHINNHNTCKWLQLLLHVSSLSSSCVRLNDSRYPLARHIHTRQYSRRRINRRALVQTMTSHQDIRSPRPDTAASTLRFGDNLSSKTLSEPWHDHGPPSLTTQTHTHADESDILAVWATV